MMPYAAVATVMLLSLGCHGCYADEGLFSKYNLYKHYSTHIKYNLPIRVQLLRWDTVSLRKQQWNNSSVN